MKCGRMQPILNLQKSTIMFTKTLSTAAKAYMATHAKEVTTIGVGAMKTLGATAVAAAPYTVPGVVSGVAGGAIAHATCDDPQDRAITGAVIGGAGGAVTGFLAAGPVGAVTNGTIGAITGGFIGQHEF